MSQWWNALERELGARSELAADPWSHRVIEAVSLTDAQRSHLAGTSAGHDADHDADADTDDAPSTLTDPLAGSRPGALGAGAITRP